MQYKLTHAQTLPFSKRKGVDSDAVYNFLCTRHYASYIDNFANVSMDALLYKWNEATLKAIQDGLKV